MNEEKRWLQLTFLITLCLGLAYGATVLVHQQLIAATLLLQFPITLLALCSGWLSLNLAQKQQDLNNQSKRQDTLFEESYEHVVLKRQTQLHHKVLHPTAIIVGQLGMVAFAVIQHWDPWAWQSQTDQQPLTLITLAFMISGCFFVAAKTLNALGQQKERFALCCPGGFMLYSSLSMVCFSLKMVSQTGPLSFTSVWFSAASSLFALVYIFEWPCLATAHYYGKGRGFRGYSTPGLAGVSPEDWLNSIGKETRSSLQYQYGSDNGIRQLFVRHGGPAFIVFICSIISADCIVIIKQTERGLLTHWGTLQPQPLSPGLHLKWPRPIQDVNIVPHQQRLILTLGHLQGGGSYLWDSPGHEEDLKLLTRTTNTAQDSMPIEALSFNATILYEIKDPKIWFLGQRSPLETLKATAMGLLSITSLQTEWDQFLGDGRTHLEQHLQQQLQEKCDLLRSGFTIHRFSLPQVHPPSPTVEAFTESIKAGIEGEARLAKAHGESERLNILKKQLHLQETTKAHGQAQQKLTKAAAFATRIKLSAPLIDLDPAFYWGQRRLDYLTESTKHMHKVLLLQDSETTVQSLNLETNLDPELLDLNLEAQTP